MVESVSPLDPTQDPSNHRKPPPTTHPPGLIPVYVDDGGAAGVEEGALGAAVVLDHGVVRAAPVQAGLDHLDGGVARQAVGQVQGHATHATDPGVAPVEGWGRPAGAQPAQDAAEAPEQLGEAPEGEVRQVDPGGDEEDEERVREAQGPGVLGLGARVSQCEADPRALPRLWLSTGAASAMA